MGFAPSKIKQEKLSPYQRRIKLLEEVLHLLKKKKDDEAPRKLIELRKACGMDLQETGDTFNFPLDNILVSYLLDLTLSINVRRTGIWEAEVKTISSRIKRHISPPKCRGKMPAPENTDLTELSLTSFPLHSKTKVLSEVGELIRNNKQLTSIELAYTGVSNADISHHVLQPASTLKHLTYLGLKGNRLDKRIIDSVLKLMNEEGKFPSLRWIDLHNNADIFTLPQTFLEALKKRYPVEWEPDFQEIANGDIVFVEDLMTLNV